MKVLHIINNLGMGGAEKMLLEIILEMKKNTNYEVDVLLLNDRNSPLKKYLEKENVNIIVLNYKSNYSPMNLFSLVKHMKSYDIIHSHIFPANYWTSLAKLFLRDKIIITTEHNTHNKRRNNKVLRPIEKFIYSRYDKVIAISNMTKVNLLNWLNLSKDNSKYIVIDNAIDLTKFDEAKPYDKSIFFKDTSFILTMVGSFSLQKDQETIIRALLLLPENVILLLVGDGKKRENLLRLIANMGVHSRVKLLGTREDVPSIMKTSNIVIVSSNWEGFGLVAVEGMAAKKPVIASDVDGLREVVKDFGLLFKKGDEQDLADQIIKLMDIDYYNEISLKCYKHSKNFSIEKLVKQYLEIYESAYKKNCE